MSIIVLRPMTILNANELSKLNLGRSKFKILDRNHE